MKSVAIFFIFLLLSAAALWPLTSNLNTALENDGDQPVAIWSLLLMGEKLLTDPSRLYEAPVHYPHSDALRTGYNDYVPAIFYYLIFLIVGSPITAYNILYIGSIAANGFCMYVFVYYLTRNKFAGFVSGMVYALCPMRFGLWGFVGLQTTYWMPLAFLFMAKFFDSRHRPYIYLILGLLLYLVQFLSDMMTGVFFGLAFFPYIIFELLRRGRSWKTVLVLLSGVVVLCGLVTLAAYPYIRLASERGEAGLSRGLGEIVDQSADIASYVNAPPSNILYGGMSRKISRFFSVQSVSAYFTGFTAFALAVCGILIVRPIGGRLFFHFRRARRSFFPLFSVRFCRDPRVWFFFFLCIGAVLFSLGPEIHIFGRRVCAGPYILIYKLFPPIQSIRAVSWMAIVAVFSLSILAGYGTDALMRGAGRRRNFLAVCLVVLLLAESLTYPPTTYGWPYVHMPEELPEVYRWLEEQRDDGPIIELPMPWEPEEVVGGSYGLDSEYTYWTLFHDRLIVNCYVSSPWPEYKVIVDQMKLFPSRETIDILRFLGVRYVILHTDKTPRFSWQREIIRRHPEAAYDWADTIRRMDNFEDDLIFRAKFGPDYVYELVEKPEVPSEELEIAGEALDRPDWKVTANQNSEDLPLIMDNQPATAWVSSTNKRAGIRIQIDLGDSHHVTGLIMGMRNVNEYPKNLRVEVSSDGRKWREVDIGEPCLDLVRRLLKNPGEKTFRVSFPEVEARLLRITLTRWDNLHPWSIAELNVYGRDSG